MWADVRAAFSFLTILPLGYVEGRKPGWSFAAYPLVGVVIGALLALVARLSPFSANITAFLVVLVWAFMTGGLHLDGFGDSCDSLLATVEPERRLEIMKDPHSGSWAVVGLLLLLLGKWAAVGTVSPALLILPPIVGRWGMVVAAYHFPYARKSGLGGFFRDGLGLRQVGIASLIALVSVSIVAQAVAPVFMVFGLGALVVYGVGNWAARRLGGGITGDTYGALCELIELVCLLGLTLWSSA